MAIPEFRVDGWLPEGHHPATWQEVQDRFEGDEGSRRAAVFRNLLRWRDAARAKGITGLVILNGSFISAKPEPGDFDLLLIYDEATDEASAAAQANDAELKALLDPALVKQRFSGDVFAFSAGTARMYPQFVPVDTFDRLKVTLVQKGVLEVEL